MTRPTNTRPVGLRTRNSLAALTQSLKAVYAQQKQEREFDKLTRELQTPSIPKSKGLGPMSKNTSASYGANVLRTCPGGARDEARTGAYAAYLKQVDHPETGCVVVNEETQAGQSTLERLTRSARNSNTTQGNYSRSVVH